MRELRTPHMAIRYRAEDFIALWRCNESGSSLIDEKGDYNATVVLGTVGSTGGLFASPSGATGARSFWSSRATAAGDTAARNALLSTWTISVWVKPNAAESFNQFIVSYAGGNTLASLALGALTLRPFVLWRNGTTDIVSTAALSAKQLTAGGTFHVAVVKDIDPVNAGRYRVTFYIDGIESGSTSNLLNADGGTTSPQWDLGTNQGGSEALNGTIDDLAVLNYAATPQKIRDIYARGASSVDVASVYASRSYKCVTRVAVYTADGAEVDLTSVYGWDLVRSVRIEDDVDNQGATCSLELVRNVYQVNVSPLMATSAPNVDAGGELLAINRRVVVETAILPDGAEADGSTAWDVIFDGFIDGIDYAGEIVRVDAMDKIMPLQDVWIEPDRTQTPPSDRLYGSNTATIPVETDIQQLIADNVPPTVGYVGGTPALYVPASPGWAMNEVVTPSDNNVAGKIGDWVGQIGWLCRYRWDDYRQSFRFTLYEPERTKVWTSGDPSFSSSEIIEFGKLEVRRDEIRNVGDVEYGDAGVAADNTEQWKRLIKTASDAASIAKYGRRYFRVSIDSVSENNNATFAQKLVDYMVSDLKEPKADAEVTLSYRHHVEIGDIVRLEADDQRFSSDQAFAVVGLSHSFSESERKTSITLRAAAPIGRRARWWDIIVTPGLVPAKSLRPLPVPTDLSFTPTVGGVRLIWKYPRNAGSRRYLETEIHRGPTVGFTPSAATLVSVVRGKSSAVVEQATDAVDVHYKFIHRDDTGTASSASAALTTSALSSATVTAGLDVVSSVKGLVPALPTISPTAKFLRGDGTWEAPPAVPAAATSVVAQTSYGQSSAVGTSTSYARADHTHGTPSAQSVPSASNSVVAGTSFGQAAVVGASSTYARGDHSHGTPTETQLSVSSATGSGAADILAVSNHAISAVDAGADRIVFWDDSAGKLAYLSAGTNLFFSGTNLNASIGKYRLLRVDTYTSGSGSITLDSSVSALFIEAIGGGGGGGGVNAVAGAGGWAAGGSGGGYASRWVSTDNGTLVGLSHSYQVGAGGSGGSLAGGTGGTGGLSFFRQGTIGAIYYAAAYGGVGGSGEPSSSTATLIKAGAWGAVELLASFVGDVVAYGGPGGNSFRLDKDKGCSGAGGNSAIGAGGGSRISGGVGLAGEGPGGGGGGAACPDGTADALGGAGAAGMVRVWQWY